MKTIEIIEKINYNGEKTYLVMLDDWCEYVKYTLDEAKEFALKLEHNVKNNKTNKTIVYTKLINERIKKFYSINPNNWINFLGKNNIIIYPVYSLGGWKIEVFDGNKKKQGSKSYTSNTYLEGWYTALEFMYTKLKQKV